VTYCNPSKRRSSRTNSSRGYMARINAKYISSRPRSFPLDFQWIYYYKSSSFFLPIWTITPNEGVITGVVTKHTVVVKNILYQIENQRLVVAHFASLQSKESRGIDLSHNVRS
jgi:hypothetical protein